MLLYFLIFSLMKSEYFTSLQNLFKGTYYGKLLSFSACARLNIWNVIQRTKCELRRPSHFFVGWPAQKALHSTSHSDLALLPMSIVGSFAIQVLPPTE